MNRLWAVLLTVSLTSLSPSNCGMVNAPPPGWRFPVEQDYSGDWKPSTSSHSQPFHIHADFNGDAIEDDAWILLSKRGSGWGVFVFLGTNDGRPRMMSLETEPDRPSAQQFGIRVVEPGVYDTACRKDNDCASSEPATLQLQHYAINFFSHEGVSVFFWWDADSGKFKRTQMGH